MKKVKVITLITLVVLAVLASKVMAIEHEGGARFIVGEPVGKFGDTVTDPGFGLAVHYGFRPQPALTFGIGLQGVVYGSESRSYDIPLVEDFKLKTSNNLAGAFLFTQYRPLQGCIQPYVEIKAGVNYLWTESKLEDKDWYDDDEVARETNYDDFASFYGGGGGLLIRLSEGNPAEKSPGVYLDLKVTYLKGSEAEYLSEGDIEIVDNKPIYSPSKSETDLMTYEMGVVLTF